MKYADRVVAARQKYLDIGSQFGAQRMADLVSIALNDPAVMGKNALGAERLGRVFERVKELEATFDRAFCKNAEQDYWIVDPGLILVGGYSVGASANWAVDENGKALQWGDQRTAKARSKTFPGIAKAMAEQWGGYITEKEEPA